MLAGGQTELKLVDRMDVPITSAELNLRRVPLSTIFLDVCACKMLENVKEEATSKWSLHTSAPCSESAGDLATHDIRL